MFNAMKKMFKGNGEDSNALKNMENEINKHGGALHFTLEVEQDGWAVQCKEFPGIITGGKSSNPSNEEVFNSITSAVHTAFHVSASSIKFSDNNFSKQKVNTIIEQKRELSLGAPC